MAKGNNVELQEKRKLVNECFKCISKEEIEKFFGIKIRLDSDEDEPNTYNIYKGDELIFGKMRSWDVKQILRDISEECAHLLCNSAEKDKNSEAARKKADELEIKELEFEKKHYVICPICGITYNSFFEIHHSHKR